MLRQQGVGRHQLAGDAEAALRPRPCPGTRPAAARGRRRRRGPRPSGSPRRRPPRPARGMSPRSARRRSPCTRRTRRRGSTPWCRSGAGRRAARRAACGAARPRAARRCPLTVTSMGMFAIMPCSLPRGARAPSRAPARPSTRSIASRYSGPARMDRGGRARVREHRLEDRRPRLGRRRRVGQDAALVEPEQRPRADAAVRDPRHARARPRRRPASPTPGRAPGGGSAAGGRCAIAIGRHRQLDRP